MDVTLEDLPDDLLLLILYSNIDPHIVKLINKRFDKIYNKYKLLVENGIIFGFKVCKFNDIKLYIIDEDHLELETVDEYRTSNGVAGHWSLGLINDLITSFDAYAIHNILIQKLNIIYAKYGKMDNAVNLFHRTVTYDYYLVLIFIWNAEYHYVELESNNNELKFNIVTENNWKIFWDKLDDRIKDKLLIQNEYKS